MKARLIALLSFALLLVPTAGNAQISPAPGDQHARIRTIEWPVHDAVILTAINGSALTLIFVPGEQIERVAVSDRNAFTASIAADSGSLSVIPQRPDSRAEMIVETSYDSYSFLLETGQGMNASYVVRFVRQMPDVPAVEDDGRQLPLIGQYRISGDEELRPVSIADDGEKTYIEWGQYQSLPAVFGVGPSGEEEVVPGYMRDGVFTIDRIYSELVFRIDRERVRARRRQELGSR